MKNRIFKQWKDAVVICRKMEERVRRNWNRVEKRMAFEMIKNRYDDMIDEISNKAREQLEKLMMKRVLQKWPEGGKIIRDEERRKMEREAMLSKAISLFDQLDDSD